MRFLLTVVLLLPVCGLAQEKEGKKGPPPEPKNLKVLTGRSGAEVIQAMRGWNAALGVMCVYCHVQGDFASDENPKKETARMMVTMAREINGKFADGKQHVSCYTCHRGSAVPPTAPPAAEGGGR